MPELAVLRDEHWGAQVYGLPASDQGSHLAIPPVGRQLEIRTSLMAPPSDVSKPWEWGVIVFGSDNMTEGTRVGVSHEGGKTAVLFVDRTATMPVNERDVRGGPMPPAQDDGTEGLHIYIDQSLISVIASNETAITVWTHPVASSDKVALFATAGREVQLCAEAWALAPA